MRVCIHCGMTNHTINTCFKKYGYHPCSQPHGLVNNVSHDTSHVYEVHPEHTEKQLNYQD